MSKAVRSSIVEGGAQTEPYATPENCLPPIPHVTPRRSLFGAAALLALATPARAADHQPDAELIAVCAQYNVLERRSQDAANASTTHEEDEAAEVIAVEVRRLQQPLLQRICETRFTTLAGAAAVAASLELWEEYDVWADSPAYSADDRLRGALLRGLIGGAV